MLKILANKKKLIGAILALCAAVAPFLSEDAALFVQQIAELFTAA